MTNTAFIDDMSMRRTQARKHIMNGAVTESDSNQKETILNILNEALATELICVRRYNTHNRDIGDGLPKHTQEEQGHIHRIAERISQLGGHPDFNPQGLMHRSHGEYNNEGNTLDMLREDLIAERIAIDSYRQMVRYVSKKDPITRRLLEDIITQEEEHADELALLIKRATNH